MSVFIWQKLVENTEIQKFKWDILGDFQTLCEQKENLAMKKKTKKKSEKRLLSKYWCVEISA